MSIREFKTEQRIQIAFSYKGVECRELLSPRPVTQTTVNLAGGLRAVGVHAGALASGLPNRRPTDRPALFQGKAPGAFAGAGSDASGAALPTGSVDNSAARLIAALN